MNAPYALPNGGPAFPSTDGHGMTLRDWFAGLSISAGVNTTHSDGAHVAAVRAYKLADAMIAEREKISTHNL